MITAIIILIILILVLCFALYFTNSSNRNNSVQHVEKIILLEDKVIQSKKVITEIQEKIKDVENDEKKYSRDDLINHIKFSIS